MPIDLSAQAFQFLLRQFQSGNVVLFAGAGFSVGAQNRLKKDPPTGRDLSELLAEESGWKYDGEDLPVVYSQARMHLGASGLNGLLAELYKDCVPTNWHSLIASLYWYRIYTTNIDDVVENSYRLPGAVQILDSITCPAPYQDHDQFYEHVQCVHLHGSVLDFSKTLTFTLEEFASQTAKPNPWYQAMVENMQSRSFVFVGTRLSESPFYHYLALRTQREAGTAEPRAKAYVVTPSISPIRRRQFEDQNFVVIDATAEEFFSAIVPAVQERIPSRIELLKNRYPHHIEAINAGIFDLQKEVLRQFELVSGDALVSAAASRTFFFDGAEPTWEDIRHNVDAEREITSELLIVLQESTEGVQVFALTGQAGSGKSTTFRRLAFELARAGRIAYFSKMAQKLDQDAILSVLKALGDRHIYVFLDDARSHVEAVNDLIRNLSSEANITFVLADRPHILIPRLQRAKALKPIMIEMPPLIRADCERIILKLEEFGFPGALRGKSREQQLREFLGRSRKQLLVAMKEATSGHGFDVIIEDEYRTLASDNARLAYAIACLAYMHGAPVRRRHLLACLDGTDVEKANTLEADLSGVVIRWGGNEDFVSPRHRVIADQVSTGAAALEVKQEAIKRFLTQISAEVTPQNIQRRTSEFIAYRGIINFDNMQQLFGDNYDVIEEIYDQLKDYYGTDYLFWLQYGRAEVYFDNFSTAQNYLTQSINIRGKGNFQAKHNMGVLFLKRARFQVNASLAAADAAKGEEILREQIRERGDEDSYGYSALVTHKLRYFRKYPPPRLSQELEELKDLAQLGLQKFPFSDAMKDAHQEVLRAYLMTAVPAKKVGLPAHVGEDDNS